MIGCGVSAATATTASDSFIFAFARRQIGCRGVQDSLWACKWRSCRFELTALVRRGVASVLLRILRHSDGRRHGESGSCSKTCSIHSQVGTTAIAKRTNIQTPTGFQSVVTLRVPATAATHIIHIPGQPLQQHATAYAVLRANRPLLGET